MTDLAHFDADIAEIVGAAHVLTAQADMAGYVGDWRGRYHGQARAVIRPANTAEVSEVVKVAHRHGVRIVPQSGNTGLVGGAVPDDAKRSVVLSLSRMRTVREVDLDNNSVTVEAGLVLAELRDLAASLDRLFPVNLGAVGSAQVGGLVSTNAGGTEALRYGTMRDQVLGLEVVLADGRVLDGLRGLRKDNSGYDLKHLFIGTEGTLGIVTAAVLKLWPRQMASSTAMVALPDPEAATRLLGAFYERIGNRVESFELINRSQIQTVQKHRAEITSPMPLTHDWYTLIEISDPAKLMDLNAAMEEVLGSQFEDGTVSDAVIAQDLTQAARIWEIRHSISEANKDEGFTVSNDTSVPVSRQPAFLARVTADLMRDYPQALCNHCGHMGDGNVHVIVVFPHGTYDYDTRDDLGFAVNRIVHMAALEFGGSIAAEHGIGRMHVRRLAETKSPVALDLMRQIKRTLDPKGTLNPGKILARDEG